MSERNQAEELSRAANRITDAVKDLTAVISDFLEHQQDVEHRWQRPARPNKLQEPYWGGLPEGVAVEMALRVVHEVREEMERGLETDEERLPAPSPEEVRKRREERRKREAEDRS